MFKIVKEFLDFYKSVINDVGAIFYIKKIFLLLFIVIIIKIVGVRLFEYLEFNNNQIFIIESIKILDQRIQDREKILKWLEEEYDKEITSEGRASVQRRIDLAQEDLSNETIERNTLAKKVKDKSKIEGDP